MFIMAVIIIQSCETKLDDSTYNIVTGCTKTGHVNAFVLFTSSHSTIHMLYLAIYFLVQ